jgi:hypothetical protein
LEHLFINTDIPPEVNAEFRVYSDDEMKRLNAEITQMDVQIARCLLIHQMLGTRISDTLTLRPDCLTRENGQDMIEIYQVKTKRYKKPISKELAKLLQSSIEYTQEKFGDTEYIFVNEKEPDRPMQYMAIKTKVMSMIQEKQLRDDHGELFGFGTHMFRHYYGVKLTEMHLDDWTIARLLGHVAEIHKGAEVSIKEYFYGNSYFSHGATQDVISSMINNKSKSMSFFYKDEIIPCKMRIGESICIDEKVGTMYLYPIISKDFRRVCKETGVKEGCFFNTFSDLSSMASFFEIGSKIYHSNSMDTFGYTEQLEKMYRNKSTENEKTIFWFGIELVNGNDVEKKLMSFEYACNWNSLSGYVCALVAEWCLNDEISKGKAYNLDEIEGIQKFIESLPGEIKQNIVKL